MSALRSPGSLSALAHRDFRIYWAGQTISLVGVWMQQLAQQWVVVQLTGSKAAIATVHVVASLPVVALSLHGGVVADQYERRKVLMATQLGLAILAFVYAGLIGFGQLGLFHVYLLALFFGVIVAFDLPAQHALVPQLVPPEDIPQAIALNQSIFHGSRLVGPSLAGLLIAATSTTMAFVANGISYFAVILSLALITPREQSNRSRLGGWAALKEGLRYIHSQRQIRAVIGFTALTATTVFPFLIVFLAISVKTLLAGNEKVLGLMMSASGLGAMLGALALLRVSPSRRGKLMVGGCAVSAAALVGITQVQNPWTAAVLVATMAFSVSLAVGLGSTMLQVAVPEALRGRVMGVNGLAFGGLMPAAALVWGAIADTIGLRATLGAMGITYGCFAVPWLLRSGVAADH
ncbi:MAG: MFS transporter [Pseudomonadota bacterium]